jgi:hypothetical protein
MMLVSRSVAQRGLRIGVAIVGVSILAGCSQVTYGTGVGTTVQTLQDFAGIVMLSPRQDPIVYEERPSTLAMPPNNTLPPPVAPINTNAATTAAPTIDPCGLWAYDWSRLGDNVKEALGRLGWTEINWRSPETATWPASSSRQWNDLRLRERQGAETLGFTQASWDSCVLW